MELLSSTLENILQQEYTDLEIILVDDHSDADISSIVDQYADSRIKLFKSIGTGPGAARNTGLGKATGEYIKFFDSDDLMTRNAISSQVASLEQTLADMVFSPYFKAELKEKDWTQLDEVMFYNYSSRRLNLYQQMIRGVFIPIPCFLFRRSALNLKWIENYTNYEDWIYLWNIAKSKPKIAHENESAFLYRIHGPQSTMNNFNISTRDRQKLDCLVPVLMQYDSTFFDSCLAKGRIYHEIITISDPEVKKEYEAIVKKVSYQLCGYIYRIVAKLERMKGGGKWGRLYGATSDKNVFQNYMKLIITK